ncbi:MAG: metallophosphoesterase [Candidatus Woesearchaeota archaeon]
MLFNRFNILILLLIVVSILSCTNNRSNNISDEIEIDETEIIRFGVISDIHADTSNIEYFMDKFIGNGNDSNNKDSNENVDAVLVLGDFNDMNGYKAGSDFDEIRTVMETILNNSYFHDSKTSSTAKVPVYVIPGNHEAKAGYEKVMNAMKIAFGYDNLHDMSGWNIETLSFETLNNERENKTISVNLIPIPGYHLKEFTNPNGYLYDDDKLSELENKIDGLNKNSVNLIVAHGLPLGKTRESIDAIFTEESGEIIVKNVGNPSINKLMQKHNIKFGVFGHIHEAGMKAAAWSDDFWEGEKIIKQNKWSSSLFLNPGPAVQWKMNSGKFIKNMVDEDGFSKGSAGILEIAVDDKIGKYEIILVR